MLINKVSFSSFKLNPFIMDSLIKLKYVEPSPIQSACIPALLKGQDVLGIAQTGSGKTAAFVLPFLQKINIKLFSPQILVLAPTRELAVQVGETFTYFSKNIKEIKVVVLYGGQQYNIQFNILRKGPQIVVGTPGRLLDHLKRKTLNLSSLFGLVIDEADEMLRMGFIEDVENILSKIPKKHQTALFSATMPNEIKKITKRFMSSPKEIYIHSNIKTQPDIQQNYCLVNNFKKNDTLIRFLEIEKFDAVIIFVRTKYLTLSVCEFLKNHNYNCAALNGDMNQNIREKTIERLKNGSLNILIATDVASRGLDLDRISLVINYDIPMDSESYIHRIGRTGRAGRTGKALLFVENREKRMLQSIQKIMKLNFLEINIPNNEIIMTRRLEKISDQINYEIKNNKIDLYKIFIKKIISNLSIDIETLSYALIKILQNKRPLILPKENPIKFFSKNNINYKTLSSNFVNSFYKKNIYRINLGSNDKIETRHIVGAIANEGKINGKLIGNIKIFPSYSTVQLPKNLSKETLIKISNIKILNKLINISLINNNSLKRKKKYSINFKKKINKKFYKK
ncbi:DEAD/DEAH box helicase [Sodalis-like secondary symbiont of Drepanosiphum platanoidis]|uniref:DEAD/DEAH box helicase n=1 Tax=Sodalis-like secondary symbiont of Drepanosiphum platanoidis TaxID=2994493 RepID=UPI0034646FD0